MLRELLHKLSGGQITLLIALAIMVPGAVTAAVVFQPVVIVDPSTGVKSSVDSSRRLRVLDPIASYRNNPANFVTIGISNFGTSKCESSRQYTVPIGSALVITSMTGYASHYLPNVDYMGIFAYNGRDCSGKLVAADIVNSSANTKVPIYQDFSVGTVLKSGETLSVYTFNNAGYIFFHGYLIPSTALPRVARSASSDEPKPIMAAEVAAKMKLGK